MIVEAAEGAPPHFFLIGFRAPVGGQQGPDAEQVGAVVLRSVIGFSGAPQAAGDILVEDKPFDGQPPTGPFRYESEIAAFKPQPDVVVVDDIATFLDINTVPLPNREPDKFPGVVAAVPFGTLAIDRGGGFGPAAPQAFGWLPKDGPVRKPLAGTEGPLNVPPGTAPPQTLNGFKADQFDLPDMFQNAYYNGRPVAGALFKPGDRLRFNDDDGPGPVTELTIPPAPALSVIRAGEPVALALEPRVDTVVVDRKSSTFTLIWRATFPWDPALESATLEVG